MIGQARLVTKLNTLSLESFKIPILLLGESGCGKHTLVQELVKKFNLDLIKLDNTITSDLLIEYQQCPIDKFYLIDFTNFTDKQQNKVLKFIEEPSTNAYIILIAESEFGLLDTLLNRCIKYHFDDYTKEELKQFLPVGATDLSDIIYSICKTPGQILGCNFTQLSNLYGFCGKIVKNIKTAGLASTVGIETRLNYDENYDKYDFNLFINMLLHVAAEEYIATKSELALQIYLFTNKYTQNLHYIAANKENFMINFLIELKESLY